MKFKPIESRLLFENPFINVHEDRVLRGGQPYNYFRIERDDAVVVVPLTTSGRVLLLHHYRYPPDALIWEFPMGGIDPDESPKQAAIRELQEETGLLCREPSYLGSFYPLSALTTQKGEIFVATFEEKLLEGIKIPAGEDEIAGFKLADSRELTEMLRAGHLVDGFTLAALVRIQAENLL